MLEKNILILGVGNILLSDEGIGVHVIQKLLAMDLPPEIEVVDGGTGGYELINFFRNKKKVIIVDCMKLGDPPGTIIQAAPCDLELQWQSTFSVHQSGLRELLHQASLLEPHPEIVILGIVPKNINKLSMNLSEAMESILDRIVQKVFEIISSELYTTT